MHIFSLGGGGGEGGRREIVVNFRRGAWYVLNISPKAYVWGGVGGNF